MKIQLAEKNNLIEVLYIIRECSRQLMERGVKYWNNSMVDFNDIAEDISNKYVYILYINRVSVGTITIKPHKINSDICMISRLAIYPPYQNKGLARTLLEFAENVARENRSRVIKGITPLDDQAIKQLMEEKGFCNKGLATEVIQEYERVVFEKELI